MIDKPDDIIFSPPVISSAQAAVVVAIGILASLVVVVQPVVLSPLASEGRLTLSEMGQAAMLESLGMALAVGLSGLFLRPRRLRSIVALAALTSVGANYVTSIGSHETILIARFVNGVTVGAVLWVWTGLLTHIALPARNVAIFVALQSAGGLLLSTILPRYVEADWGASGAYLLMAALSAINIGLSVLGPRSYPEDDKRPQFRLPSARGGVGLVAVGAYLAAVLATWVYVVPLGLELGLSRSVVDLSVSVALAAQIAGGICAAIWARMNAKAALCISVGCSLAGIALVGSGLGVVAFMAGLGIVGFFLMFAPGFQMPYLIEVDPGRGAAMQMVTAQQLGFAAGPALSALMVSKGHMSVALGVSAALFAATAALVLATTRRVPPSASSSLAG